MLHMSTRLEELGDRGFAVLPLVSSQIPSAVFIDTNTLLDLMPKELLAVNKQDFIKAWSTANKKRKRGGHSMSDFTEAEWARKQFKLYQGQAKLWDVVLDLSKLPVRSLRFDNRIQTDGVSVAIYAEHRGEQLLKAKTKYAEYKDEDYVHNLKEEDRAQCRAKRIVAIDPGKQNIIFAVDTASVRHTPGQGVQATTLRYTAKQRAFERKTGTAKTLAEAVKATAPTVNGRTIQEWEAFMASGPQRRTLDPAKFRRYIAAFYVYSPPTKPFWHDVFHRKQRLDAYRRQQRSESRLVKNFMRTFGSPNDVVIAFGDGARNNLCGRAPGPSTAIRKLFQRNHFRILDVREAYTSRRCFACKRPDAENGDCRRGAWGVRRCCRCGTSWARDFNACLNIDRIAREHLAGFTRPEYLTVF
jgi:hypothetical protein